MVNKHILLTGAAGRIGSTFFETTQLPFRFRLTDLANKTLAVSAPHEFVTANLRDKEQCVALCKDIDTVVHLAGIPSADASFEDVLADNMLVTHNIFQAALENNCERVIVASSAQATEAYPVDVQVNHTMPVRPKNLYGVSKCFVEALASYYATEQQLSAIALRIGAFEFPDDHNLVTTRDFSAFLSPDDACHLLERCVLAEDISFFIGHGISDNRFKRLDLSETTRVLGYDPKDDAFSMFDVQIDKLTPKKS
ncbi:MAG: NAD(P)-dependent oxidoreductase [Deinococcota bacterium]